jgi:NAD(P)-dependent dehydrogenase (short-subunit alcohol dehydrogenase family)
MQAQGHGSIINISSTFGHEGAAGAAVYAASKHAVEGLTKSAALEGARSGVRVNAVAPGPTETGMLNRFTGTAERKAALAKTVPPRPCRRTGRDRARRRLSRLREGIIHHRADPYCRRRQDRWLTALQRS